MTKLELAPYITGVDVTAARIGTGGVKTTFNLSPCCPSPEQEAIAKGLQEKIAQAFTRLVERDDISHKDLDTFNAKVLSAREALHQVIFYCWKLEHAAGLDGNMTLRVLQERAWLRVRDMAVQFEE